MDKEYDPLLEEESSCSDQDCPKETVLISVEDFYVKDISFFQPVKVSK